MLRTNTKSHQFIKDAKISYSIFSLVFHKFSYQTYQNGLNQGISKLYEQKVRTMFVRYLLLEIHILVYSCTGCGTSKPYLYLEDDRSSFSRVSLKPQTKRASISL